MHFKTAVIGVSSGGLNVLKIILSMLPENLNLSLIIVQHLSPHSNGNWIKLLAENSKLKIKEADEKEVILKSVAYIAPPNYHLLINSDYTFALSVGEKVRYARPSIDVLFESAAEVYRNRLIGILLTGGNNDGVDGIIRIQQLGGLTIVQDPKTAENPTLPNSALAAIKPDHVLSVKNIGNLLIDINRQNQNSHEVVN